MRYTLFFALFACTGEEAPPNPDVVDADGDGKAPVQGDCDDNNADIGPDEEEIWYDGIDQDCDGRDDDQDEDGFLLADDCNDEDDSIFPGAVEVLGDNIDQDCDGTDHAGLSELSMGEFHVGPRFVSDTSGIRFTYASGDGGVTRVVSLESDLEIESNKPLTQYDEGQLAQMQSLDLISLDGQLYWAFSRAEDFIGLAYDYDGFYYTGWTLNANVVLPTRTQFSYAAEFSRFDVCQVSDTQVVVFTLPDDVFINQGPGALRYANTPGYRDCVLKGNDGWAVSADGADAFSITPSAINFEDNSRSGNFVAVQWEDDTLFFARTDGLTIEQDGGTFEVPLTDVTDARMDYRSDGTFFVLTAHGDGSVVLHSGTSWDALASLTVGTALSIDELDIEATADGIAFGARSGDSLYLGRLKGL